MSSLASWRRALPLLAAASCFGLSAFGLSAWAETAPATSTPSPAPKSPAPKNPAPSAAENGDNGRFAMTPVTGGLLRLDTRTGQVSLCMVSAGQAQCRASADERAALEAEIGRLAKENAALKAQTAKAAQSSAQEDVEDRKFDRALDRAEKFMRRMMQLFRDSSGKPPPTSL